MVVTIFQVDPSLHRLQLESLFWEYLTWANDRNAEEYGFRLDVRAMLDEDMTHLEKFMSPRGQLLIAWDKMEMTGCICLQWLRDGVGELKRLYVRPAHRRRGIGKALIADAIERARQGGYHTLRLDSSRHMIEAHSLYRAAGFRDTEPYSESEIPPEFHSWWIFMEMPLADAHAARG
jgi:GNAT superfamily N-acetyltransferase